MLAVMRWVVGLLGAGVWACSSNGSHPSERPSTPEGWAEMPEAQRCGLGEDNLAKSCGVQDAESRQVFIDLCVDDYRRETQTGCGSEWDTYEACLATHARFDCENEEPCSRELDSVFSCRSSFVARTGCTTNERTAECASAQPVPLYCLGEVPAGCVQIPSSDPVQLVCCPSFE